MGWALECPKFTMGSTLGDVRLVGFDEYIMACIYYPLAKVKGNAVYIPLQ